MLRTRSLRCVARRAFASARASRAFTTLEPLDEVAPATRVLRMAKPPVNSMSLEFLESFVESVSEAEADKACRAVIVAARPGIFSAGLDINEMWNPDEQRLRRFWRALQEMWFQLSTSKVATVAAIEGHAPAGGCFVAISCDWRTMALEDPAKKKPFTIGLNETKLGIVAPTWFGDTYSYVVGQRQADWLLQTGALVPAERAAAIGLVDEAVPQDEVMATAAARVKELLSVPDEARWATKMLSRGPMVERLRAERDGDIDHFVGFCFQPAVQKALTKYMEALKARSAK